MKMFKLCQKHKTKLILLTAPISIENQLAERVMKTSNYLHELAQTHSSYLFNANHYIEEMDIQPNDMQDTYHLTPKGMDKFSIKLAKVINEELQE